MTDSAGRPADPKVAEAAITWRHDWAPHLFSFRVDRPDGIAFVPGQFVRLGVVADNGTTVWRAYSIASPPAAAHLEFYSIVVPDGPFSQPLARLGVGDRILVDRTVYGFLRADRFNGGRALWLIATGTGIAPFMAMLGDEAIWRQFQDVVVVHSARTARELAYRAEIEAMAARPQPGARLHYVPIVTSQPGEARIGARIADRSLERSLSLEIDAAAARLMICGNPSMIKDVRALLRDRGLTPVRRDVPGQFIVENFW